MSLVCITPPAAEPISLDEFKAFLDIEADDTSRDAKFTGLLVAAREDCERWTRTKLVTQTWLLRMDSFPGVSVVYDRGGYPCIQLPYPPLQSVEWVKYVDTAGVVQIMTRDASNGTAANLLFYCYQLEPGGGIKPARIAPMWARPYPPSRLVLANTMVQFRCGYGGPLNSVSIAAGSKALTVSGFKFNPDDAPQITGDTGTPITISGAGESGDLVTHIAAVDSSGNTTLADAAATDITGGSAWLGQPIPPALKQSILFDALAAYEPGVLSDAVYQRVVVNPRVSFRNLVS